MSVPRIGPPTRPGPFLKDIVDELREVHKNLEHLALVTSALVEPPLEQQLPDCEEFVDHLVRAVADLESALSIIAPAGPSPTTATKGTQ